MSQIPETEDTSSHGKNNLIVFFSTDNQLIMDPEPSTVKTQRLCCLKWQPLGAGGYWILEMWLV